MSFACQTYRKEMYSRAIARVIEIVGERDVWTINLQQSAKVRSLAIQDDLADLEYWLGASLTAASKIGFREAADLLKVKRDEVRALKQEAAWFKAETGAETSRGADWGKKGRAARIIAWARANGETWQDVAAGFDLAKSTAQRYVRLARKIAVRIAA